MARLLTLEINQDAIHQIEAKPREFVNNLIFAIEMRRREKHHAISVGAFVHAARLVDGGEE